MIFSKRRSIIVGTGAIPRFWTIWQATRRDLEVDRSRRETRCSYPERIAFETIERASALSLVPTFLNFQVEGAPKISNVPKFEMHSEIKSFSANLARGVERKCSLGSTRIWTTDSYLESNRVIPALKFTRVGPSARMEIINWKGLIRRLSSTSEFIITKLE